MKIIDKVRKIQKLINSKLVHGSRILMAYIRIIDLKKILFLMEFELGNEVLIPQELRQDDLPLSFRYYDFIINLIQEKVSYEKREFFKVKKQVAIIFDRNKDKKDFLKKNLFYSE